MEVRKMVAKGLLFTAIFGMAGMTRGQEGSEMTTITTEGTVQTAVVPAGQVPAEDWGAYYPVASNPAVPATMTSAMGFEVDGYVNAGGMFNDHSANYNMIHSNSDNQLGLDGAYLAVTKKAQNGYGVVDWGFGADVMFGRDARFLSGYTGWDSEWEQGKRSSDYNRNPLINSDGLTDAQREDYGMAMPQLYVESSMNNWTFKVGHFYTLMGYEGARADQRFFYGFGRNFEVTPITHSGALATFKGIQNMEWTIGWVAGENNTFERDYDESLITGAVTFAKDDNASAKYSFLVGDGAMFGSAGNLFRNDVTLSKKFGPRWEGAMTFNYGSFDAGDDYQFQDYNISATLTDLGQVAGNVAYQTWGGYLYYTLNSCWKIGNRVEWQRATTDITESQTIGMETFNFGFGANWTPCGNDHFVIRPEIRYDDCRFPIDRYAGFFGNEFSAKDQLSLGVDLLCKF